MSENFLMIKKDSFFVKFKKLFMKIFNRQQKRDNVSTQDVSAENIVAEQEGKFLNFKESVKEEVTNDYIVKAKRNNFIEEIEQNPDLMENLSTDRLEKLDKYYDKIIQNKEERVEELNRKLA